PYTTLFRSMFVLGPPAVTINASSSSICTGVNVTFTATPTNGGATPTYQWQVNGVNAGTNSSTYSSTTLSNNDQVKVILTATPGSCGTFPPATSNIITMTVSSPVTPSVSVSPSATNTCQGTNITFTATPVNGGSNPSYQWRIDGSNVGPNNPVFNISGI